MSIKIIAFLSFGIVGVINGFSFRGHPPGVVSMTAHNRRPTPCVAPKQFQSSISQFFMPGLANVQANVSYDAYSQRVRTFYTLNVPGHPRDIQDILYLYGQGIAYSRNVVKGTCVKTAVPRLFPTIKVPSNATFYGSFTMGRSLFLNLWYYKARGPQGMVNVYDSWTGDGSCWPVSSEFQTIESHPTVGITTYMNMTLGIRSASTWYIPKGCRAAEWRSPSYFEKNFGGMWWYQQLGM